MYIFNSSEIGLVRLVLIIRVKGMKINGGEYFLIYVYEYVNNKLILIVFFLIKEKIKDKKRYFIKIF